MDNLRKYRIALIGCGPHAKRIYIKYMHSNKIEPSLIIDISINKKELESLVLELGWKNTKLFFIKQKNIYNPFSKSEKLKIVSLINDLKIKKAIISTPPEIHTPYAKLCLDMKIKVLVDKPLSSPKNISHGNSIELINDMTTLLEYDEGDNIVIQCQRRRHIGYKFIKKIIEDTYKKYKIAPHFIEIYHSDGRWDFPDEIPNLTNHPYGNGYGKLLHSGYHFIDLLNFLTSSVDYDEFELFSYKNSIDDFKYQIPDEFYKEMFNIDNKFIFPKNQFGEIDVYSLIKLKKEKRTLTTASVNLLHTGFSRRAWGVAKPDLYKGNGRLRHEMVNIQIGPLMNIQVHSYQSTEINDHQTIDKYETGGLEHFDIHIYRNSDLIGGKSYELIKLHELNKTENPEIGQNENARYQLVKDFIDEKKSGSDIKSHIKTNILIAGIAESMHTNEKVSGIMKLK